MRRLRLQCTILIILACLSIISVGFASWVFKVDLDTSTSINGSIKVDEAERKYSFKDLGITISSTTSNIEYAERNGEYVAINHSIIANLTFDMSNSLVKDMDFATGKKIGIFFSIGIFNGNGTQYDASVYNKISSVTISLSNYTYLTHELNKNSNRYYIPLKSKTNISLYSFCMIDSTIPNKTDYNVPFKISFNMDNFNFNISECTFKLIIRVGDLNE